MTRTTTTKAIKATMDQLRNIPAVSRFELGGNKRRQSNNHLPGGHPSAHIVIDLDPVSRILHTDDPALGAWQPTNLLLFCTISMATQMDFLTNVHDIG